MALAVVLLVLSASLLGVMITALVLLRRGEGPAYSTSRAYDGNRREALRVLTGETVESVPGEQWYDRARKSPRGDEPMTGEFRAAVGEALRAVVPATRGLAFDDEGNARLEAENAWAVPAVSTADLRAGGLERWDGRGRLVIGVVLFNPEPPGGEATRVALPVQALFPALVRAGRDDLVRRFEALRARASEDGSSEGGNR